jgi:hypothetical protein
MPAATTTPTIRLVMSRGFGRGALAIGAGLNAAAAGASAPGVAGDGITTGIFTTGTVAGAAATGADASSATATGSLAGRLPPSDGGCALPRPIADDSPEPLTTGFVSAGRLAAAIFARNSAS